MLKFAMWKTVTEISSMPPAIRGSYNGLVLLTQVLKKQREGIIKKANDAEPKDWRWRLHFDATPQPHDWEWKEGIGWCGCEVPPQSIQIPMRGPPMRVATATDIAMWLFYRRIEQVEPSLEGENPTGIDFINEWTQLQKEFNYNSTALLAKYEELHNTDQEFRHTFAPPQTPVPAVLPPQGKPAEIYQSYPELDI